MPARVHAGMSFMSGLHVKGLLVMSKNRVAPTKRVTLPRLELLAAFMLSKLLKLVLESLKVTVDRIVCWSDSLVALSWIQRPSRNWKLFVANQGAPKAREGKRLMF